MIINPQIKIESITTIVDRISDKITAFVGSMKFVVIHAIWFTVWLLMNLGVFGQQYVFDSYPFGLLTLIVSLEAIFLSTFVMISQNRESAENDIRAEADYLTNLKAEKENKVLLKALFRMAEKQHIPIVDLEKELADIDAEHAAKADI